MSILRELFCGITYYISDPATFRSFCLAHPECWKIARQYTPMKKKEFTKVIETEMFIYRILPNGAMHGWLEPTTKNRYTNVTNVFNTSKFIAQLNYNKSCTNLRMLKNTVFVFGRLKVAITKFGIEWTNIINNKNINTVKCPLCLKYHYFIAANYWIFRCNCFDTKFVKQTLQPWRIDRYFRRMEIARSIIEYSKKFKM